jgi:hypothetical protein
MAVVAALGMGTKPLSRPLAGYGVDSDFVKVTGQVA